MGQSHKRPKTSDEVVKTQMEHSQRSMSLNILQFGIPCTTSQKVLKKKLEKCHYCIGTEIT